MRVNGTLYFVLKDHLGSASVVTDSAGVIVGENRYYAFGETRLSTGTLYTDKLFTGQRNIAGLGIYHYQSRFYSPYLNHFTQPDTLISDPYNPQAWNRYAYVLNNPIRYNDPTGHAVCTDDGYCGKISDVSYQKYIYSNAIREVYQWNLEGNWSLDELQTIYQTGRDIEMYVDDLTGGMGLEWMNEYLGGTTIEHWSGPGNQTLPWWVPGVGQNTIYLQKGGYDAQWFAHELGHIWDINSGRGMCGCGAIGGVGDSLNTYIGGNIASTRSSRYDNYWGKPPDPNIKSDNILGMLEIVQFNAAVNNGYGNGSTADYLAESFAWNVIDRRKTPIVASVWVDQAIIAQAAALP